MLPTTKTFSPYTVEMVGANATWTIVEVGVEVGVVDDVLAGPVMVWPTRIAMAPRAGTVAANVPELDTVKLRAVSATPAGVDERRAHELPEHVIVELTTPVITLQYVPAGSDVEKVADHALSALLIAT
jgi:hypothetical protein